MDSNHKYIKLLLVTILAAAFFIMADVAFAESPVDPKKNTPPTHKPGSDIQVETASPLRHLYL